MSRIVGALRPENWSRAEETVRRVLETVCDPPIPRSMSWWRHPAVDAALLRLPSLVDEGTVDVAMLAEEVGISVSRLTHVFRTRSACRSGPTRVGCDWSRRSSISLVVDVSPRQRTTQVSPIQRTSLGRSGRCSVSAPRKRSALERGCTRSRFVQARASCDVHDGRMKSALNRSAEFAVRYAFVPLLAVVGGGAIIAVAPLSKPGVIVVVVTAMAVSFAAEWFVPFDEAWNSSRDDRMRDAVHAIVNESSTVIGVLAVPTVVSVAPTFMAWPKGGPFVLQVLFAVVVLDIGITVVHWWSHRNDWLWRFHAVHHSVTRMYGFNGLVKHPVHQAIETSAGMLPLVLFGVPGDVATAVAGLVVVQLLLQHSNVDYRVGAMRRWAALGEGHRLHHVARVPDGNVNFGLFLLIWDRLLGTFADPTGRSVAVDELGVAGRPAYPVGYLDQLREPFKRPSRIDRLNA